MPDGEQLIHFINGNLLQPPFPADSESAVFGMGCFWGAEKLFWPLAGIGAADPDWEGSARGPSRNR